VRGKTTHDVPAHRGHWNSEVSADLQERAREMAAKVGVDPAVLNWVQQK